MSIFFKFGVEAGDPMKVNCDGMDMNLGELKLAIKDIKGIKNVTDFDLQVRDLQDIWTPQHIIDPQVENSQNKEIFTDEAQLIPRGTTVQVSSHWSTVS